MQGEELLNFCEKMEKLGGGGHQTMAGAQIKNSTPKEALDMLKKAIDEYIEESNILGTHS